MFGNQETWDEYNKVFGQPDFYPIHERCGLSLTQYETAFEVLGNPENTKLFRLQRVLNSGARGWRWCSVRLNATDPHDLIWTWGAVREVGWNRKSTTVAVQYFDLHCGRNSEHGIVVVDTEGSKHVFISPTVVRLQLLEARLVKLVEICRKIQGRGKEAISLSPRTYGRLLNHQLLVATPPIQEREDPPNASEVGGWRRLVSEEMRLPGAGYTNGWASMPPVANGRKRIARAVRIVNGKGYILVFMGPDSGPAHCPWDSPAAGIKSYPNDGDCTCDLL